MTAPARQRSVASASSSASTPAAGPVGSGSGTASSRVRSRAVVARAVDVQRPRPGGRATRVVSSVLQATIEEVARLGYEALRVEDVAVRASVNKTTIYRRWPTKTDLVIAALREASHDLDFIPDTGSVRGDMLSLLERSATMKDASTVRAFVSLILAEFVAPEIARLVTVMRLEYRERWIGIVRRGMTRGELPPTTSAHLLAELAASVPTMRKLRNDEPLDAATREAIVDLLLAGARTAGADTTLRPSADKSAARTRTEKGARVRQTSGTRDATDGVAHGLRDEREMTHAPNGRSVRNGRNVTTRRAV